MSRYFDGRYIRVKAPDHPRSHSDGYAYEHILIAEQKLGRPLLSEERVDHGDADGTNNDPDNLTVCRNQEDHMRLERQRKALAACGHPDWFICGYCGRWDDPVNMYVYTPRGRKARGFHRECKHAYNRRRWADEHK